MTPSPPGLEIVRECGDQRIRNGVEEDRDSECQGDEEGIEPQHLVVEEEGKGVEGPVLDRVGNRTDSLVDLAGKGEGDRTLATYVFQMRDFVHEGSVIARGLVDPR